MSYTLSWEANGVVKLFTGRTSDLEVLASIVEIESDPRFENIRWVINDFLRCTGFEVSKDGVDLMAATDKAASVSNANVKVAVIATDRELVGMAKHYADSPMNVYPTQIFSNRADAHAWLGA